MTNRDLLLVSLCEFVVDFAVNAWFWWSWRNVANPARVWHRSMCAIRAGHALLIVALNVGTLGNWFDQADRFRFGLFLGIGAVPFLLWLPAFKPKLRVVVVHDDVR